MKSLVRARLVSTALALGVVALGLPALALAQEATPVGTPAGGPMAGFLSIDPTNPVTLDGQLTRIAPDGSRTVIASEGLTAPTGLAVDADGNVYVAVYGVVGDMGQVWKIAQQP